jgi:hypothetical protein
MVLWPTFQKYANYALIAGAAVLVFLLMMVGARRQGERVGKVKEQLRSKQNVEKAREKLDAVPRPERSDVLNKLRDGKF